MFSIYIGYQNESSQITFGGYDSFKIKKDDDEGYGIHWYDIEDSKYWQVEVVGSMYGDYSLNNGEEFLAILDSGV